MSVTDGLKINGALRTQSIALRCTNLQVVAGVNQFQRGVFQRKNATLWDAIISENLVIRSAFPVVKGRSATLKCQQTTQMQCLWLNSSRGRLHLTA